MELPTGPHIGKYLQKILLNHTSLQFDDPPPPHFFVCVCNMPLGLLLLGTGQP